MIQRRRFPVAIAALVAGFAIVAALPSGSTQARWSDSTTLEQPLLRTVSDAEPVSPPDITIGDNSAPSNPDAPHTSPGFAVTPDRDVTLGDLTVRRGNVVRGTGMPNLPNHVDIDVWLTPAAGANTCQTFGDSLESGIIPDGAVRLGDTVQRSDLNSIDSFSFLNAFPMIAADTTRSVCPIVTITKGSAKDYAGSSFELIFRYTFTSPTSGKSISGEITTLYAINAAGTSASTAPDSDSTEAVSATGTATAASTDKASRSGAEDSEILDHSTGTENSSREPGQAEETEPSAGEAEPARDIEAAEFDGVAP